MRSRDASRVFVSLFYSWLVKLPCLSKRSCIPTLLPAYQRIYMCVCVRIHGARTFIVGLCGRMCGHICVCVKVRESSAAAVSGSSSSSRFRLVLFQTSADVFLYIPAAVYFGPDTHGHNCDAKDTASHRNDSYTAASQGGHFNYNVRLHVSHLLNVSEYNFFKAALRR